MYNANVYLDVHVSIYPNMYSHGHLVTIQMRSWVEQGLDRMRGQLVADGFGLPGPRAPVHCRHMGGPAASGKRRAIFTVQDKRSAEYCFQVTWAWWAYVPVSIDARGWRGVSQHWEDPAL